MIPRIEKSGLKYNADKLKLLNTLVDEDEIDYYRIVNEVESIF